jgi:hypothetical protein
VVLYLHVPKAGGTTLSDWLFNQLRAPAPDGIEGEEAKLLSGVYYYPSGYVRGPAPEALEKIRVALGHDSLRGVLGHFPFGLHGRLTRPSTYVTMLRDPVSRVVSLYNFQRLLEESMGEHEGVRLPAEMSIEDFVREPPYKEVDNGQTRRISGLDAGVGHCSDAMLQAAQDNLRQHFSVVGITERFDETLVLLARTFSWPQELLYYPRNVTVAGTHSSRLPEATIDLIRERNAYDIELYEFVMQLLDEAIAAQGQEFVMELERFHAAKISYFDDVGGWDMPAEFRLPPGWKSVHG